MISNHHTTELWQQIDDVRKSKEEMIAHLLTDAQNGGTIREDMDAKLLSALIMALIRGVYNPCLLYTSQNRITSLDFFKEGIQILIYGGDTVLENIPTQSTMTELLGQPLFEIWQELCSVIEEKYDMERLWNTGGKNWTYEYKYRRGGKTLCSLYARRNCVGFMIIFGKDERAKFEDIRDSLSDSVCRQYDEATTYRDGKWVMFEPTDTYEFDDYMKDVYKRQIHCLGKRFTMIVFIAGFYMRIY